MAIGRVLRTDSTSIGDNTVLVNGALTAAGGRLGITAFCSFKIVWLWKKLFRTFALSVSSVYIVVNFEGWNCCFIIRRDKGF